MTYHQLAVLGGGIICHDPFEKEGKGLSERPLDAFRDGADEELGFLHHIVVHGSVERTVRPAEKVVGGAELESAVSEKDGREVKI